MQNDKLFKRYEFKYLLNSNESKLLYDQALKFMKIDDYATDNQEGYSVRSLYYDNDDYDNFYEKADGVKFRKKFRFRTYGKHFSDKNKIFLEMKGRNQNRVLKKRIKLNNKNLELFNNLTNVNQIRKKYDSSLINEFLFDYYKKKLKPKIIIDYNRMPLVNTNGLYFRLTFDKNIFSGISNKLFTNNIFYFPLAWKPGFTILEVKFIRSIPAWFHRIIQSFNLNRRSISKFVIGIENCSIRSETSS